MYAGDFNDNWLPGKSDTDWYSNKAYRTLLGGSMAPSAVNSNALYTGGINAGLVCPNALMSLKNKDTYGLHAIPRSYGVSAEDLAAWGKGDKILSYKVSKIVRPSERMAFADGRDWALFYDGANPVKYIMYGEFAPTVDPSTCYTAYRHGKYNQANVGFFDGHVATLRSEELWKRYRFTGFYNTNNF